MAQIQFASRSLLCKLVYYGPGLAGKTTNLEFIYEKAPEDQRGELTSIATSGDRTIVFDYLPIEVGKISGLQLTLQLYTVPGQPYYASTRKLVLTGVDGVVFVADSQRERMAENISSFKELLASLEEQNKDPRTFPIVLQWNKRDLPNAVSPDELNRRINKLGAPAFEAVATSGKGVLKTLKALSKKVIARCHEEFGGERPSAEFVRPPLGLETDSQEQVLPQAEDDPVGSITAGIDAADSTLEWDEDPTLPAEGHATGDEVGGCVIMAKLGEGGMGTTYVARVKNQPKKTVVVKTLKPGKEITKKRVKRFFREARSAARLDHENVVRVEEVGTDERGMHYMIMQHVDGVNLKDHVEDRGRMEPFEAARIVLEVAKALDASHRAGVIHRDVKPDNVVIGEAGDVKLIDFGLARDLHAEEELTRSGGVVGTIMYMAPEMFLGQGADGRADVFSLGLTFYFLITGQQPYEGRRANEVIAGLARLTPPKQVVPDLSPRIEAVLEQMLQRDPDKRYRSARAVVGDLEALWSRRGPSAPPPVGKFWLWDEDAELEAIPAKADYAPQDDGRFSEVSFEAQTRTKSRAEAKPTSVYSREVINALDAWDAVAEGDHESSDHIKRLVESAWGEVAAKSSARHRRPSKSGRQRPSSKSGRRKKGRTTSARQRVELLGKDWRRDLTKALEQIEAADVKEHKRKRLSRDPGQAEVNALLRRGPARGGTRKIKRGKLKTSDTQLAIGRLTDSIKRDRGHPQPWTKRGIAKARAGDLAGAVEDYTRALDLDPNFLPALANRGTAHFHLRRYALAEEDCTRALKRAPRLAKAWLFRGISRAVLGHKGAREDMLRFLKLCPFSPYVHYIKLLLAGKVAPPRTKG